jgi:hypothetical protein
MNLPEQITRKQPANWGGDPLFAECRGKLLNLQLCKRVCYDRHHGLSLIGKPVIEFDGRKFEYIGVSAHDTPLLIVHKPTGIESVDSMGDPKLGAELKRQNWISIRSTAQPWETTSKSCSHWIQR